MNKNSIIDYASCILFRLLSPLIRSMPKALSFFLGRRLGDLLYCFDARHRAVAYTHIKTAFGDKLSLPEIRNLAFRFYRAFGQNLIEIFLIPLVDKNYFEKYIRVEGRHHITEAFKKGRGVIFLGMHEGSWELSSLICANMGFPFVFFVRDQRYPRLDKLLNSYRIQKGCRIIQREGGLRQLVEVLKSNQAIGMTADQGGRAGTLVKFFGREASMPTGAVKLALKYGSVILPSFYVRLNGPYIKVIIEPPFEVKKTGNADEDLRSNLQGVVSVFEERIARYPQEYLWSYKIWKYGRKKGILILSDAKTGHLRQSQALAKMASEYFKGKDIKVDIETEELRFKDRFSGVKLTLSAILAGKYTCQGCAVCLKWFLERSSYDSLIKKKPDVIISCGSSLAPVNLALARESMAKSIVIMRPSVLGLSGFDLIVMPKHDNPPKRKNIAVTEGALNLIDGQYIKDQSLKLKISLGLELRESDFCIGLLIGGDAKDFSLGADTISEAVKEIKSAAERLNAFILVTTSRRTSKEVEELLKNEFMNYPRCKLLIIANEKNVPEAVGGILGLSQVIVISPESISMISEAAGSGRYVLVFKSGGLDAKHKKFLDYFAGNKYIYFLECSDLGEVIENIRANKPPVYPLNDNFVIARALKRIL